VLCRWALLRRHRGASFTFLSLHASRGALHRRAVVHVLATSLKRNEKIIAMSVQGSLVFKLSKARVDELVEKRVGARFEPGRGRVMKEWLSVRGDDVPWLELVREAHDNAS